MDKVKFNDGEEAVQEDYNAAQHLAERALQEALYEIYGQESGFIGDGFLVEADSGMDLTMAIGLAYLFDSAEADPDQARYKVARSAAVREITVPAADPTNPRIDIVCIAPDRLLGDETERLYMDEGTSAITPEDLDKRDYESYAYSYVTGTPAGSPSAPAVPSGYTLVASIDVAAAASSISGGDITDDRSVLPTMASLAAAIEAAPGRTTRYTYTTTTQVVPTAGAGTYTATIPIGAGKTFGVAYFRRTTTTDVAICVSFGISSDPQISQAMSASTALARSKSNTSDATLIINHTSSYFGASNTGVLDCYIDGTDWKIVFKNNAGSDQTLDVFVDARIV